MSDIKPLKDSILFTFVQTTRDGYFRVETDWGFKLSGSDYATDKARWGLVEKIGPMVKHVKVGDYVLIEPLKWTTAVEFEGKKFWRTAEPHILGVQEAKPEAII